MSESKLKLHENPARLTATALVLLGVFFVALNVLVSFTLSGNRIDLTEDKLYSVSDASQSISSGDTMSPRTSISRPCRPNKDAGFSR